MNHLKSKSKYYFKPWVFSQTSVYWATDHNEIKTVGKKTLALAQIKVEVGNMRMRVTPAFCSLSEATLKNEAKVSGLGIGKYFICTIVRSRLFIQESRMAYATSPPLIYPQTTTVSGRLH